MSLLLTLPPDLLSLITGKCHQSDRYELRLTCTMLRAATPQDTLVECLISMLHFVIIRPHTMLVLEFRGTRDTCRVYPSTAGLFHLRKVAPGPGAKTFALVRRNHPRLNLHDLLDMVLVRRADLVQGVFYKLRKNGLQTTGPKRSVHCFGADC